MWKVILKNLLKYLIHLLFITAWTWLYHSNLLIIDFLSSYICNIHTSDQRLKQMLHNLQPVHGVFQNVYTIPSEIHHQQQKYKPTQELWNVMIIAATVL